MKGKALLFGLNYSNSKSGKLNGCINDVYNISRYIKSTLAIPIITFTDDIDLSNTSYDGIIKNLHTLAIESYRDNLDFVWIHYSGHGSYKKDTSGDELDGMDEGLVPSDYEKKGILLDDILNHMIASFNPKTKILFVCDSCHSGTMLDLKYTWQGIDCQIDNQSCNIIPHTILISGCMDNQTSADAFNLLGDNQSIGALTACILKVLKYKPGYIYDVFSFIDSVRSELKKGGFSQFASLSSNYDLTVDPSMISTVKKDIVDIPSELSAFKPIHQPSQQQSIQQYQPPQQQSIQQYQPPLQQPTQQYQPPLQQYQQPPSQQQNIYQNYQKPSIPPAAPKLYNQQQIRPPQYYETNTSYAYRPPQYQNQRNFDRDNYQYYQSQGYRQVYPNNFVNRYNDIYMYNSPQQYQQYVYLQSI